MAIGLARSGVLKPSEVLALGLADSPVWLGEVCSVPGCERPATSRGLCGRCFAQDRSGSRDYSAYFKPDEAEESGNSKASGILAGWLDVSAVGYRSAKRLAAEFELADSPETVASVRRRAVISILVAALVAGSVIVPLANVLGGDVGDSANGLESCACGCASRDDAMDGAETPPDDPGAL